MKEKIVEFCKLMEKEHKIKILFAVESGSRLWRMESKDSDYDVRFVFVQPIENYISTQHEKSQDLVINSISGKIDLSGFDIFKFCKLLLKSNPSVIEWLQSDIIYYGEKPKGLVQIAFTQFNPQALFYHYQSMCKQNYEKYLDSKKEVTYKKYLYAMRGLINAKYVEATGKLPPIRFIECLDQCKNIIPLKIIQEVKDTITKKKNGTEEQIIKNIIHYDLFIEDFLREKGKAIKGKSPSQKQIDLELKKIILMGQK